ncbi:amidohydrolase family protein [Aquabacter sp. CN5-332]|uniref:amidohydrolase family protein n=1 Tax=Aquabacter sp. CN5-332 TaxID=3156608 RepID=UPI0032B62317
MAPLCLPPRPVGNGTGVRVFLPGTCDTHMHVFGPAERYPLVPARNYTPHPVTFADYRPVMAALGIDRAVLVQPSVYGTENSALLEALGAAPDALRGVVVVPPDLPDADLQDLHRAGVRGIRVNRRNPGGLSLEHVARLGSRIAPLGWHIQLQIEIAKAPDLVGMVERCPVPVVIDHFGFLDPRQSLRGGPFAQVLRLLEGGNLWVKLSAPYRVSLSGRPYADLAPFVAALISCRPDRLLWATDWPHTELWADMPDDMDPADRTIPEALPAPVRSLILVENPARLYGFALPAR